MIPLTIQDIMARYDFYWKFTVWYRTPSCCNEFRALIHALPSANTHRYVSKLHLPENDN